MLNFNMMKQLHRDRGNTEAYSGERYSAPD